MTDSIPILPAAGDRRLVAALRLLTLVFLCQALVSGANAYWLAVAAGSYFLPKSGGARIVITLFLFALLAFFSWGRLFAGVLLFAALLVEAWFATSRSRQLANFLFAGFCMFALLFSGLPAISIYIEPVSFLVSFLLPALLPLLTLEIVTWRQQKPIHTDPLLIIIVTALTMCYLLAVALLADSIAYPQAILLALLGGGALLAVLAVLTAPFMHSGNELNLLQHIFALHVPIEKWAEDISAAAAAESSAVLFTRGVMQRFLALPGVIGVSWRLNERTESALGSDGRHHADIHCPPLFLRLHTSRRASPWDWLNYYLLARISAEYCRAKIREEQNRADSLSRAVHQTGARLTHDIKNILHTLAVLTQTQNEQLLRRQLPILYERLQTTLTKLRAPEVSEQPQQTDAAVWWHSLQARYLHQPLQFASCDADHPLPPALFDIAAENFIDNALVKQQTEKNIGITVRLLTLSGSPALHVEDSGAAVPADKAALLFTGPVESETGFGVGLYQVQVEAAKQGYECTLINNRAGAVVFQLAVKEPPGQ